MMSKRMSRYPSDRKVYVGDLGSNARKNELEHAFSTYGTLRSVWIARNPPGFAFVEFADARDASDAVRGLDGRTVCGRRARVELSTGRYAGGKSERRGSSSAGSAGRPFHPDDKCYECGGRGHYARDCRRYDRRHRRSPSRSRSYSRSQKTRSCTGSRSNTSKSPKLKTMDGLTNSTQNDYESARSELKDDTRNGSVPKTLYNSSNSPKGFRRNTVDSVESKISSSNSRRDYSASSISQSPNLKNVKDV